MSQFRRLIIYFLQTSLQIKHGIAHGMLFVQKLAHIVRRAALNNTPTRTI